MNLYDLRDEEQPENKKIKEIHEECFVRNNTAESKGNRVDQTEAINNV